MRFLLFFLFVAGFCLACQSKKAAPEKHDKVNMQLELIAADKEFSAMSEEKGMKTAFIDYLDSNGVLLRSNQMPIIGANAIDFLLEQDDSGYSLTWDPRHAEIAQSGELGYTYGVYALRPHEKDTIIYGTYVSIWKKQLDGKWKLVLDSGNDGIGGNN